jgi:3-methyladenine DNA glycosylase AlkD
MNTNMHIKVVIAKVHDHLGSVGNPARAQIQKNYLKSPFTFYGVSRQQMQKIARSIIKKFPAITQQELIDLCSEMWADEYHELKSIAIDIMHYRLDLVDEQMLDLIDHMIDSATGWDHIDEIAIRLVGHLLKLDPKNFDYLRRCEQSDNFWKRRVSIIAQLKLYKTDHFNQDLLFEICTAHLYEKEFFIRKAIGWALRELSKTKPNIVFEYIHTHKEYMSGLTFREGVKRLPEKLKIRLKEES